MKRIFSGLILDFWLLEIGYYLIIGAWLLVISLGIWLLDFSNGGFFKMIVCILLKSVSNS